MGGGGGGLLQNLTAKGGLIREGGLTEKVACVLTSSFCARHAG